MEIIEEAETVSADKRSAEWKTSNISYYGWKMGCLIKETKVMENHIIIL